MTLMTPFTALAPHNVAPGPLMTSIRSTSTRGTSCTSQNTPEYNGVYTVRPSMSTRSLLAVVLLNPRALMAHCRESTCATCRLVARRKASGRRSEEHTSELQSLTNLVCRLLLEKKKKKKQAIKLNQIKSDM